MFGYSKPRLSRIHVDLGILSELRENPTKGSFKCYVTLEGRVGICPSVTKRYEGVGGGGLRQRYVTSFFLANCLVYRHVRHGCQNNLDSISNIMFLCIMLTTKTGSHINN